MKKKTRISSSKTSAKAAKSDVVAERLPPTHSFMRKTPKRATNLTLDPDAVARGEEFGELHGTSLSKLVTGFLYTLPVPDDDVVAEFTPTVRRLYGLAAGSKKDHSDYREHLLKKYGTK